MDLLSILVLIINLNSVKLVPFEEEYEIDPTNPPDDDRTRPSTRTAKQNLLSAALSRIYDIKKEQIYEPIDHLDNDEYLIPIHYSNVYKIEDSKDAKMLKPDSNQTLNQYLAYKSDVFGGPTHFNEKINPPDTKFFEQMRENPLMNFWNESFHMKKPEPVKKSLIMKFSSVTEKGSKKAHVDKVLTKTLYDMPNQYYHKKLQTLQTISPGSGHPVTFFPKFLREMDHHSYFLDESNDTEDLSVSPETNRVRNRVNVAGMDVEIWRSEKASHKNASLKNMDIGNYNHYLSNVPKQNRKLPSVHPKDDTTIADALAAKIRVLCWVVTHPKNHKRQPSVIKATWGRKCTKLIFVSSELDASIPTVKLQVREGREYLWGKMKVGLQYIYDHHLNDADWFLRTDDDTYIIMENLRYLLASHDYRKPLYLGCRFRPFTPQGYMSGGAGVVLSKEALDRVVNRGLRGTKLCEPGDVGADDDVKIGICLHRVGVQAVDTRDSQLRGRFWPFRPQHHVMPNFDPNFWYWQYTYYPNEYGIDCCSDYSISFHYQSVIDMYTMEFLIYRLRPYGIHFGMAPLPTALSDKTAPQKRDKSIYYKIKEFNRQHMKHDSSR